MIRYLCPNSVLADLPFGEWLPLQTPIAIYPRDKAIGAYEFGDVLLLAVEAGPPIEHFAMFDEVQTVRILGHSPTGTWTYAELFRFAADCAERMPIGPDHPVILAARRHGEQRADLHVLQQAVDDFLEAPLQDGPASMAIMALVAHDSLPMVSVYAAEAIAGNDVDRFTAEKLWQSRRLLEYFEGECSL